MHTTNYTDTLILPATDCRAAQAEVPTKPGTIGAMQHAALIAAPYGLTSDDLIVTVLTARKGLVEAEIPAFRATFFSKGQACLRASPLVKTYGWALYHDAEARVALIDPASARFGELSADAGITKVRSMRSRRA